MYVQNQATFLTYLANWPLYTPENGSRYWVLKTKAALSWTLLKLSLHLLNRMGSYQNTVTCTVHCTTICMGTSTICLHSIKPSLPSSLGYSYDKLFRTLLRFSILQATESWVGPGNKASSQSYCWDKDKFASCIQISMVLSTVHNRQIYSNSNP